MFRSNKILKAANECPYCLSCGSPNHGGNIIAAHSNQLRDGKGKGIKAHDFRVAYVCDVCHRQIDEGNLSKEEKIERWEEAHRNTIGYLFLSGVVK